MLTFSGYWIADYFCSQASTATSAKIQMLAPMVAPSTNDLNPTKDAGHVLPVNGTYPSLFSFVKFQFILALWGAFVWSLYEILTRRMSGDLTPVELYDVVFRYLTAVPVGYAFSLLVTDSVAGFVAFTVSAFPIRDLRQLLRKQALQKLGEAPQASSAQVAKGYIGEVLSGMGNDTIARLQELNIESYLDLAYTDPVRLVIKTGVPIQLALTWIDQALLAAYFPQHKAKFELLGMPCALDLCEFYTTHCFDVEQNKEKDWRNDQAVKDLSTILDIPIEILVSQPLKSIFKDPYTEFLVHVWYEPDKDDTLRTEPAKSPYAVSATGSKACVSITQTLLPLNLNVVALLEIVASLYVQNPV